MLFNSYGFIFLFLPLCLTVFTFANRWFGARGGVAAIVRGSLAFYASWDPRFLVLLLLSVGLNFGAGLLIADASLARQERAAGRWLAISACSARSHIDRRMANCREPMRRTPVVEDRNYPRSGSHEVK